MVTEGWHAGPTPAPTAEDRAAVEAVIRDYFDGWFDADGTRVTKALHPGFAKRSIGQDRDGTPEVSSISAEEMILWAGAGNGAARGRAGREYEIRIDEISGDIASASVHSEPYVEFVHLARMPVGWRIVNALWRYADGHGPAV